MEADLEGGTASVGPQVEVVTTKSPLVDDVNVNTTMVGFSYFTWGDDHGPVTLIIISISLSPMWTVVVVNDNFPTPQSRATDGRL